MSSVFRILVLEDERILRDSLQAYLEDSGFQIATASNGREGLEAFEKGGFNLVLVDLRMPEMNGVEFIEKARGLDQDIKVMVLTGCDRAQISMERGVLGVPDLDIHYKPVDLTVLEMAIRKKLEES